MNADAHGICGQIPLPGHQHGMHFRLLGPLDFSIDLIIGIVALGANHIGAKLLHDAFSIVHQRFVFADSQHPHLFGRKPERKIPGVMLDEKTDESLIKYYSPGSARSVKRNQPRMHGIGEQLGIFRKNNSAAR